MRAWPNSGYNAQPGARRSAETRPGCWECWACGSRRKGPRESRLGRPDKARANNYYRLIGPKRHVKSCFIELH